MWNIGVDRDEIADRLARRRYDKKTIESALSTLPAGVAENIVVGVPRSNPGQFLLIACGLLVFGIGTLMLIANRALHGQSPILVLGFLVSIGGSVLIRLGQSS